LKPKPATAAAAADDAAKARRVIFLDIGRPPLRRP
jgi:hypothetical protein